MQLIYVMYIGGAMQQSWPARLKPGMLWLRGMLMHTLSYQCAPAKAYFYCAPFSVWVVTSTVKTQIIHYILSLCTCRRLELESLLKERKGRETGKQIRGKWRKWHMAAKTKVKWYKDCNHQGPWPAAITNVSSFLSDLRTFISHSQPLIMLKQ